MIERHHLKRLDHIWTSNPHYFITVCTADRAKVLAYDRVVEVLLTEWEGSLTHRGWAIGSYCVMPDHVHFFCTDAEHKIPLRIFIGKWKEWTSKRMQNILGVKGGIWQPGFFDHLLRSDESYSEKWDYVWRNPVRAELVSDPDDWSFSGFVHYK